jgi:hypothetical protein
MHIVDTREYVDGDNRLNACIQDNGCVSFATCTNENTALGPRAAVSSIVLRQLADMADAAKRTE